MSSKKILISSNYAWTIFNFRMNLIRRLKKEGFEVIILTQFDGYENDIKNEVDEIKPLFISRKGINPFVDLVTFFSYLKSLLFYKP
ncbi:MAG: glycosyltransferase family 1 protein, partial [Gammaproteobacteria bacterium]|nr:glycosyltransferase family 1 protein [Gammaproteobacteria bacterium]